MKLIIFYALAISALTYAAYFYDKSAARQDGRRISEARLLQLAFFGGAPAALAAMYIHRHKIRKPAFRYGVPMMLLLQSVAIAYLIATSASDDADLSPDAVVYLLAASACEKPVIPLFRPTRQPTSVNVFQ